MISEFNISISGGGVLSSSTAILKGTNIMEGYRVEISTPGAKIFFRGKVSRTPVEFKNVTDSELEIIKLFTRQNLLESTIKLESEVKKQEDESISAHEMDLEEYIDKEVVIEELKKEPLSIMDKLIESEEQDEKAGDISRE